MVLTAYGYKAGSDSLVEKVYTYNIPVTLADYVITTATEYRELSKYVVAANTSTDAWAPSSATVVRTNGYFVLGGDVKFTNWQIVDEANAKRVALIGGTFDGQGYTIDTPKFYGKAMFEYIRGNATIKDLYIKNANLEMAGGMGAILARYAGKGFEISNVHVQMNIVGKSTNQNYAYGLIGVQRNNGSWNNQVIKDCTVVANVSQMTGAATPVTGLFLGANMNQNGAITTDTANLSAVKMTNCIGIIADTNASGYTVSGNLGTKAVTSVITQTNCGYYANWTEYSGATLTGYNANMLTFIDGYKK